MKRWRQHNCHSNLIGYPPQKSGRLDSNQRPLEPHSSALAKLRHAPNLCMVMQAVIIGIGCPICNGGYPYFL